MLHRQVARQVLGSDPAQIDALVDRVIDATMKFPWSYVCRALSGVDTALWDLYGKIKGLPVCALFGGKAVGDGLRLLADGNSCYTPPRAIEVGRRMEDHNYYWFEAPCPYWELEWTAEVAAALKMNVAGGEQDNDLAQWRRMIGMNAVDLVQPGLCYAGGITRSWRVAKMGQQAANSSCRTPRTCRSSRFSHYISWPPSPTPDRCWNSASRRSRRPANGYTARRSKSWTARSKSRMRRVGA